MEQPLTLPRQVLGSTTLYLLALIAPRVVRLVAVPVIVHAVAPDVYGTFATLLALVGFGYGITDLGLATAAVRLAPEMATDEERRSLFATMLLARAAAALVVTVVVLSAMGKIAGLATGNAADGPVLALLFVSLPIAAVFDGYTHELRSRESHAKVALLTVLRTVVQNGLTLLLVIGFGLGLYGLSSARPVTDLVLFVIGSIFCWNFVRGRFRIEKFKGLWEFGWPIGLLTVLGALRGLDRPLIRVLSSVDQVAAYDLAMRMVGPIALPSLALALVLQPIVYRHALSPNTPRMIDLYVRAYVGIFSIVAMAVAVLAPEIIPLIAPRPYHAAIDAVPALMFFQLVDGLMRVAGIGAELVKRTRVWAIATATSVIAGMSLVPILVPPFAVGGAGFALFLGTLAGTVLTYLLSLRVSGLTLPILRGAALSLAGALIGTAAVVRPWPLAARGLLFVVFSLVAWRVSGVRIATLRALLAARSEGRSPSVD